MRIKSIAIVLLIILVVLMPSVTVFAQEGGNPSTGNTVYLDGCVSVTLPEGWPVWIKNSQLSQDENLRQVILMTLEFNSESLMDLLYDYAEEYYQNTELISADANGTGGVYRDIVIQRTTYTQFKEEIGANAYMQIQEIFGILRMTVREADGLQVGYYITESDSEPYNTLTALAYLSETDEILVIVGDSHNSLWFESEPLFVEVVNSLAVKQDCISENIGAETGTLASQIDFQLAVEHTDIAINPETSNIDNPFVEAVDDSAGTIDVSDYGDECTGLYVHREPDFRFVVDNLTDDLVLAFLSFDTDTGLVVHTPGGRWMCSDDAGVDPNPQDPGLAMTAESGSYEVWLAGKAPSQNIYGLLLVATQ